MTMLPRSPGFNPWQQALYGLSSGLMAAGSPGGFRNFGAGVGQGVGQFQDNQARLVREQILQQQFDMQKSDHEARQAEKDAAQKRQEALRSSAGGLLQTYDDDDPSNDALGALSPAQLSLARLQLENNPEGLLTTLGDWTKPKDADWQIKTIREGNQDVTYRINPLTGEREQLGSGMAFKPGSDGTNLSIAAPVWGMDKDGNPVLLQMSQSGVAVQTQLPEGVTPVRPNVQVDTGTGTAMVSPVTAQVSNVIPKDVAGKQAAEEIGTATGKVAAGLPDAIAKAQEATQLIEGLKTHPGREYATGKSSILPTIPGTDSADFHAKLDQLRGTVFLQAYSQLKGGGAITEMEGKKAEQAIARLDTAQSEGEFVKALDELNEVINAGLARMNSRAGGAAPTVAPNRVKVDAQGNVIQ
jgi:hypothetical protein